MKQKRSGESQTVRDLKWLRQCEHIAHEWSKDRGRKVAAIAVGPHNELRASGYNGFPRGANDDVNERHARPAKYLWTEHAERNVFYNAAMIGASLEGCTLYSLLYPCMDCARGIVQVGIARVVTPVIDWTDVGTTQANSAVVRDLFAECQIQVAEVAGLESPKHRDHICSVCAMAYDSRMALNYHRANTGHGY